MIRFFHEFSVHETMIKGINITFIVLILKVDSLRCLADFRPIFLVNSVYKILSKVLANHLRQVIDSVFFRLKQLLPKVIRF